MKRRGERRIRQSLNRCARGTVFLILSLCLFTGCSDLGQEEKQNQNLPVREESVSTYDSIADIPEYSGEPYVEINDNQPEFEEQELATVSYESYSGLDDLGRCQEAEACIGKDLMPTEERESISQVKPTGWENKEYDNVDGGYLYNRCHLIGYQLSGENANEKNLITGTRYMNTEGMLPFENMVAEYVQETDNHVLYRVTPVFEGDDLLASGVQMEAMSVEDDGQGVCFNIYAYNVQPDITIDYATGENWISEDGPDDSDFGAGSSQAEGKTYILNKNTHKFHNPDCSGAKDIKEQNREEYTGTREKLMDEGYDPCSRCKP